MLHTFTQLFSSPDRSHAMRRRNSRLALERLEDRNLLANWAVASIGPISEQAADITTDALGNTYLIGAITGVVQFGTISAGEADTRSAIVAKLDANGAFSWVNRIGTESDAASIAVDGSGNIFVSGNTYVKKYNPNWNLMASANLGGDIAVDPSGNVYVAGAPPSVASITKLGSNLQLIWTKSTSGDGARSFGIALDSSGNPVVLGDFNGTVDFNPATGKGNVYSLFSGGRKVQPSLAAFVWKLDAAGSFQWARHFRADVWSYSHGEGIAIDTLDNVYTVGDFGGNVDFNPGSGSLQLSNAGNADVFVSKLNSSGNHVWARSMGGTNQDYGQDVALDSAGNVYTIGRFESGIFYPGTTTVSLPNRGGHDVFVSKLTSAGSYSWAGQLGGTGQDYGAAIALQGTNNVIAAGNLAGVAAGSDFDPGPGVIPLDSGPGYDAMFVSGFSWADALNAESLGSNQNSLIPLTSKDITPLLDAALARWQGFGVDTLSLSSIDLRIADLGGTTLGLASGRTIWVDDNAAGWGWFVDATPWNDSEFTTPSNQGERGRMDLLTAVAHEVGHLLGYEHSDDGTMHDTLATGERHTPTPVVGPVESAVFDLIFIEEKDKKTTWSSDRLAHELLSDLALPPVR